MPGVRLTSSSCTSAAAPGLRLATLAVSFTDYRGIQTPTWVGPDDIRRPTETPLVRTALYDALVFAGPAVPLLPPGALGLPLLRAAGELPRELGTRSSVGRVSLGRGIPLGVGFASADIRR